GDRAREALDERDDLRGRLVVDPTRLEDEAVRRIRAALERAPPEVHAVLGQAVAADADGGNEQAAAEWCLPAALRREARIDAAPHGEEVDVARIAVARHLRRVRDVHVA